MKTMHQVSIARVESTKVKRPSNHPKEPKKMSKAEAIGQMKREERVKLAKKRNVMLQFMRLAKGNCTKEMLMKIELWNEMV